MFLAYHVFFQLRPPAMHRDATPNWRHRASYPSRAEAEAGAWRVHSTTRAITPPPKVRLYLRCTLDDALAHSMRHPTGNTATIDLGNSRT